MTRDDQFIGQVEDYLDEIEGTTPLPGAVRDAIRAELPETKQVGPLRGLRRIFLMTQIPRPARYGLVAAIAIVAIFLGANYLGRSPDDTGSPTGTATPPDNAQPLTDFKSSPDLPAGTYYLADPYPARIEMTVPDGWWHWYDAGPANSGLNGILRDSGYADQASGWGLAFVQIDKVRVDPCSPAVYQDASVTDSAASLATALASLPGYPATVTDTTIAGYSGKKVELTRSAADTCADPVLFFTASNAGFDGSFATNTSANQAYLLDVAGGVVAIWTTDYPQRTELEIGAGMSPDPAAHVADQATLHAILDSLVITPL